MFKIAFMIYNQVMADMCNSLPNRMPVWKRLTTIFRNSFLFCLASVMLIFVFGLCNSFMNWGILEHVKVIFTIWSILILVGIASLAGWLLLIWGSGLFRIIKGISKPNSISLRRKLGFKLLLVWLLNVVLLIVVYLLGTKFPTLSQPIQDMEITLARIFIFCLILIPFLLSLLLGNRIIKVAAWVIYIPICLFILLSLFGLRTHKVRGKSMEPYLNNGVYVLGIKNRSPRRGDVVIYYPPSSSADYIARVIGLPGESISIVNGKIYINGVLLNEPYLGKGGDIKFSGLLIKNDYVIPQGSYFLLGDNRQNSFDSTDFGSVDKTYIKEVIFYVYWPTSDRKWLIRPQY